MTSFFHNTTAYLRQACSGIRQIKHFRLSYLRKVFAFLGPVEKKVFAVFVATALLSILWSGGLFYYRHTVPVPAYGGVYTEGMLGQPTYINPLLAHSETDTSLTALVFAGLYTYDNRGNLVPDIADGMPEISADQKQYTVKLKTGVKWHNDKHFTADDVVFTVQTVKDPAYKSPLRPLWEPVSVQKINDYTVQFSQKDISGPFMQNLTLPILPKAVWSKIDSQNFLLSEANLKAIGSGPYAIREIQKLPSGKVQSVTLDSFSGYFGLRPKIDSIIVKFYDTDEDLLNALHGKEIDGFGFSAAERGIHADGNGSETVYRIPLPQYQVVFFNLKNKILADQSVRQALATAVNRQNILSSSFKGDALLPRSPWSSQTATSSADTAKAAQMLDAAGWKVDAKTGIRTKKNTPLQFTLLTNDFLANSTAAESLAEQWRQLNIQVFLSVQQTKQVTDSIIPARGFDVLLFPQKFGADPDPFVFWHSSQIKTPGLNISSFSDPAADKLIVQARTTTNQSVRTGYYRQFDDIMNDKIPAFFLTQAEYVYIIGDKIKNVQLQNFSQPSDRLLDISHWYIETKRVWKTGT